MKPYLPRKLKIIISALEIIDESGIDGLSLRELARRQGITEGAIYRHFNSKEEILLSVFDYYSQYDAKIKNTIHNSNYSPQQSILFFIGSLAEVTESHPAMACIVNSFEVLAGDEPAVKKVKDIYMARSDFVKGLVEKGRREKTFNSEFPAEYLADMILGLLRATMLKWRISGYGFSLKPRVLEALELLLARF